MEITVYASKLLGLFGTVMNDEAHLAELICEGMDRVLVPLVTDLAPAWDHWAKVYQKVHPGYLDTYSFILSLENAAHFSAQDQQTIRFMVDHGLQSLYLPEIDAVFQLEQFFAELEKKTLGITKNWIFYIEIGNESGVQQLSKIIQWMKSFDRVFFIILNRQKLSIDALANGVYKMGWIQTSVSATCHQHDTPVIISNGFFESMKTKSEPSIAEICDIWAVLQCDVQGIWFREELAEGSHPLEILHIVKSIIANYITESKTKYSKE